MGIYRSLPACLTFILFANAASAAAEADSADPIETVRAYDDAWGRKDSGALETLIAPNFAYFSSKGALWSRKRFLGLLLSPKYELESSDRSELVAHRTGNTAVISSRWQGNGSYDGRPFVDNQRCSLVLARLESKWKVASEHCTQIMAD